MLESMTSEKWMSKKDLVDLFEIFTDNEYDLTISEGIFKSHDNNISLIDFKEDYILVGDEMFPGWVVRIKCSSFSKNSDDITNDFNSIIKELELDGHKVLIYESDDEIIDKETIHFKKGSIIVWIPESKEDTIWDGDMDTFKIGDIYSSLSEIFIHIYQDEPTSIKTQEELASIFKWFGYKVDEKGKIYCEIDIEEMAYIFLKNDSQYQDLISNGLDSSDFYYDNYVDIKTLFTYYLSLKEEKDIAKYVIKELELNTVIEFIQDEYDEDLADKSEEEVINFLTKSGIEEICKKYIEDLELVSELTGILSQYERDARMVKNEKEMYAEFDRLIKREDIEFTKEWKMSKRYYWSVEDGRKVRKYYNENNWVYKVFFQARWITDFNYGNFYGESLESLFKEWCGNNYVTFSLEPNYSDYGSIDTKSLNLDIQNTIKEYLKD